MAMLADAEAASAHGPAQLASPIADLVEGRLPSFANGREVFDRQLPAAPLRVLYLVASLHRLGARSTRQDLADYRPQQPAALVILEIHPLLPCCAPIATQTQRRVHLRSLLITASMPGRNRSRQDSLFSRAVALDSGHDPAARV
jgi:hypothetical protein